jgi:UDP-N-acetylmuramyl pentapeptide phosphotransferase/UDP-N-acetylglucosamine-1-phosphate transferase
MNNLYILSSWIFQILLFLYFVQYKNWPIIKTPISLVEKKVKKNKVFNSLGAIFGIFIIINLFLSNFINLEFLIILSILLAIGLIDDMINLSIFTKTFLLSFIALLVGLNTNLQFSGLPISENFVLLLIVLLFFYFINANNFLDGLDGYLSQYYIFFILSFFTVLFDLNGTINIKYFLVLTLPIIIFLYFNLKGLCMMGDCGSMLLGAAIFIFNIIILKNHYYTEFLIMNIYLFTEVPLTIIKRLMKGRIITARDFDYSFLRLVIKNNATHIFVFNKFLIYNISIFLALLVSLHLSNVLGFILSIISTIIYLLYLNRKIKVFNR